MNILYVEDEPALLSIISMEIEAEIDCKVIELVSGNKAIAWLKENDIKNLDLIITDNRMPDGSGAKLYQFIKSYCPNIPVVLTTGSADIEDAEEFKTFKKDNERNCIIHKPFKIENLVESVKSILNRHSHNESLRYYRVSQSRIVHSLKIPCDIFIKLSEEKFVKVFHLNEEISPTLLEHYRQKQIDYFYVDRKSYPLFSSFIDEQIKNQLATSTSEVEKSKIELRGLENIQDHIINLGMDEKVVETMRLITDSTIHTIRQTPNLLALVETMMKKENYLSEHSIMTSYVAGAMVLEMDWVTDSTLQKLSTAAILHDVLLADSGLAQLSHLPEEQWEEKITPDLVERIKRHPIDMAEIVKKNPTIDPHVDVIIFNHHEKMDGSGYPRHLDANKIFPLACLFIVAEDFVNRIYDKKLTKSDLGLVIIRMEETYTRGNFKKSIIALRKIFMKGLP